MSKIPEWRRWGYRPNGPGRCICPKCGQTVSTNALARAQHEERHVRDSEDILLSMTGAEANKAHEIARGDGPDAEDCYQIVRFTNRQIFIREAAERGLRKIREGN